VVLLAKLSGVIPILPNAVDCLRLSPKKKVLSLWMGPKTRNGSLLKRRRRRGEGIWSIARRGRSHLPFAWRFDNSTSDR
jgi:hypothetical protein